MPADLHLLLGSIPVSNGRLGILGPDSAPRLEPQNFPEQPPTGVYKLRVARVTRSVESGRIPVSWTLLLYVLIYAREQRQRGDTAIVRKALSDHTLEPK